MRKDSKPLILILLILIHPKIYADKACGRSLYSIIGDSSSYSTEAHKVVLAISTQANSKLAVHQRLSSLGFPHTYSDLNLRGISRSELEMAWKNLGFKDFSYLDSVLADGNVLEKDFTLSDNLR